MRRQLLLMMSLAYEWNADWSWLVKESEDIRSIARYVLEDALAPRVAAGADSVGVGQCVRRVVKPVVLLLDWPLQTLSLMPFASVLGWSTQ